MKIIITSSAIKTCLAYFLMSFFSQRAFSQEITEPIERMAITKDGKTLYSEKGVLTYQKQKNDTTNVSYVSEALGSINPYKIAFDYHIVKNKNGFQLDMIAGMDPYLTRINANVTRTYQGDNLFYPMEMYINQTLPDASGIFILHLNKGSVTILNKIEITNRVVQNIETVEFGQEKHTAYIIQYRCKYESGYNGKSSRTVEEVVTDWFIPNYGNIRQERVDTAETKAYTIAISSKK